MIDRFTMMRARWTEVRAVSADLLGAPVEIAGAEALRAQLEQEAR